MAVLEIAWPVTPNGFWVSAAKVVALLATDAVMLMPSCLMVLRSISATVTFR